VVSLLRDGRAQGTLCAFEARNSGKANLLMAEWKVLIADAVSAKCPALFADDKRFEIVEARLRGQELIDAIGSYDGLIVRSGCKVSADVLAHAKNLKAIVRAGVGVDNIDVEEATRRGVLVMNTPGGNTNAAAEHTMAMMLSLTRHIPAADATIRRGGWRSNALLGGELRGKTLGVVGLGKIGRTVAERARAFEMDLIGFDPFLPDEVAAEMGVRLCGLDELFAQSDYITLHVPLTPKTKNLINDEVLNTVRPGVRIINCARGGIIDEAALARALEDGRVTGAALDVYESEPLGEGHVLSKLKNIVLTPHLGASTAEAQEAVGLMAGQQLKDYLGTGEIRHAVNTIALDALELEHVHPFAILAARLGSLHGQLLEGKPKKVMVRFAGPLFSSDSRREFVTLSAVQGLFQRALNTPVNLVSVPHFASEYKVTIDRDAHGESHGYRNLVTMEVTSEKESRSISGTLFGQDHPRVVMIDKHPLDARPEGCALMFQNNDEPGMLGQVAGTLGERGINIINVSLGRLKSSDRALAFMNTTPKLSAEDLDVIQQKDGVFWARVVDFQ
jgi:D-3-phosphoglycerate dehydrogenase / 2-oxoglutarate reductase